MMQILYQPEQIQTVSHPGIRALLELRYGQLGSLDSFILVEPDDSVDALEEATLLPIVTSLFGDSRFPDENYASSFEVLEDHGDCYEMVFIMTDEDSGTILLIPKQAGIDSELLSLCETFATTP